MELSVEVLNELCVDKVEECVAYVAVVLDKGRGTL